MNFCFMVFSFPYAKIPKNKWEKTSQYTEKSSQSGLNFNQELAMPWLKFQPLGVGEPKPKLTLDGLLSLSFKVKKYKKTSRATSALDTSVVLECVLI